MKLAVLHYHLNQGGVTRVIQNQLRALDAVLPVEAAWQVAILYGGRRRGWNDSLLQELSRLQVGLHAVPLLEYDSERQDDAPQPETLAGAVTDVLGRLDFSPEETVVHVHNHALGKNVSLPGAVTLLAERGYALVLQPHDFAEDFRQADFQALSKLKTSEGSPGSWHGRLYPQAQHIHYALLNGRDEAILRDAGVDPDHVHAMPNPVLSLGNLPPHDEARTKLAERFGVRSDQRFLLYPVRCIRRKNVGEALVFSLLAPRCTVVGMTLAPQSQRDVDIYDPWKKLASELKLPCRFELGGPDGLSLPESVAAADLLLTTSVAEGFGMVFLESWLADRALVGRDLPEITADFLRAGVCLDRLKPQLLVPVDWVGLNAFRRKVLDAYRLTLEAYGRPEPSDETAALEAKTADGLVDFADLDETGQRQVIRIVLASEAERRRVLEENPWMSDSFASCTSAESLIRRNAEAVEKHFSLRPSGNRLLEIYQRAFSSPRNDTPRALSHPSRILDRFLDLCRFRLIRS
jgi:hypothetical protein